MNPAFGTEADLVALSAALHARGMVSAERALVLSFTH